MLTAFQSTRDKLLRAALILVAREGFPAATTAAIAEAAGFAEGTLYRHFPSKEDLLIAAYRALKAEMLAMVTDESDAGSSPVERLQQFWLGIVAAYRADIDAFVFSQRFAESELAKKEGGEAAEGFRAALDDIREAGIAAGVFKDLPLDMMRSLAIAPALALVKQEIAGRRWSDAELAAAASAVVDSWRA